MEIVVKKKKVLEIEVIREGCRSRTVGILHYLNLASVVLLMIAFTFYYAYLYLSINLSLILFFLSMLGLIIVNASNVLVKRFSVLITALLFLIYCSFMVIIWINIPSNETIEVLKSSIFYFTALVTLVFVYYSSSISSIESAVIRTYEILLLISSTVLVVQMISFIAGGIILAPPWQLVNPILFRPAGLFGEPAHFGQFSAGLIMLSRFRFEEFTHNKWRFAVVLLANLLSFSAFAFVVLSFILLRYFLTKGFAVHRIFKIVSIALFLFTFMFLVDQLPQFRRVNASFEGGGSSLERVNKGVILVASLPLSQKLLGVGLGVGEQSISYYSGAHYSRFISSGSYMNAFFSELVNIGVIGALFLNIFYLLLFVRSDDFLIKYGAFMAMRFGGAVTLTSVMCVLWLILLIIENKCIVEK